MRGFRAGSTGLMAAWAIAATAAPIVPADDAEVIERLPAVARSSASTDPAVALREASALLDAGREQGDPRLAGRALARLARWRADAQAPAPIVLLIANAEQYLHQFDSAISRLQALVQRDPGQRHAWLMLATLKRVQGRYAESDAACRALAQLGAQPYASACSVENQALRGELEAARPQLQRLIATASDPSTRGWLLTTLAELEQRAGRAGPSDEAWRAALKAAPDHYAAIGYADFLLDQGRPREAFDILRNEPGSDGVLLRRAIAARRAGLDGAAALKAELMERYAQADQRGGPSGHERERALLALELERDPAAALRAARLNLKQQREPIDILLLARCAKAAGDGDALAEARALAQNMGLHDARLAAL